jgi:hypothetical protein
MYIIYLSLYSRTSYKYESNKLIKKTASTKLKVFIQPNLVKKSYLYLGIPPLMNTNKAIKTTNFKANTIENSDVSFNVEKRHCTGVIRYRYKFRSNFSINKKLKKKINCMYE